MSDILFISLTQDINSLESLILKIHAVFENDDLVNINSWRLPSKSFLETIHFSIDEAQPTTLQYTTILEVIIERLYVLLNQYLNRTKNRNSCDGNLFVIPQKISLGALNINLWENIQNICEFNKNNKKEAANIVCESANSYTQTEEMPLLQCNSCFVAINCIKNIARQMELLIPDSFTEKNRKHLEPQIFELTQFGCMNSIITALLADVKALTENATKAQNDYRDETAKTLLLQSKLENASKSIAMLEKELANMENKNQNLLEDVEKFKSHLRSARDSEDTYKGLLSTVPQQLQIAKDDCKLLESQLNAAQYNDTVQKNQIENLFKQQELMNLEKDMWKSRFTQIHEETLALKSHNQELAYELSNITENVKNIEESHKTLNLIMEKNSGKMDIKTAQYEKLLKKIQQIVDTKILSQENEIVKLRKSQSNSALDELKTKQEASAMKGNPLEDMAKQVELNNFNIKKLTDQNVVLVNTMNKLQSIRVGKRL